MSATSKRKPPPPPPSRRTGWIIGAVVVVIVIIAGVIAIVSSGDDDPGDDETAVSLVPGASTVPGATSPTPAAASVEVGPVTMSGTPLARFEGDDDPVIGQQAPSLTGVGFDNTPRTIAPGKPTLVVFVAHWCPHCQREIPRLVEWAANGEVRDGLDVIAVVTGTTPDRGNYPPSEWLAEEGWPFPVMLDDVNSTAALAMGLNAYPFFILLDADGRVVMRDSGEIDTDDLTERVAAALGA